MSPLPVSIIGVGNMGGAMAARLGTLGWAPRVHDLDIDKVQNLVPFGALALASATQAAINTVATIVCVVDGAQTREVLFGAQGAAHRMRPGHTVLLCPTISPEDVEHCAGRLAALGVDTLDAPMSGGPQRAREGSMSLMVAGPDGAVARCRPLLEALSSQVFYLSERVGDGARTKLVNNLLAGINLVGAAEALALAAHLGLDLPRTLDVIAQSSGQSWIGQDRLRRALAGDTAARAHMTLLAKDTRLALDAAQAVAAPAPLGRWPATCSQRLCGPAMPSGTTVPCCSSWGDRPRAERRTGRAPRIGP